MIISPYVYSLATLLCLSIFLRNVYQVYIYRKIYFQNSKNGAVDLVDIFAEMNDDWVKGGWILEAEGARRLGIRVHFLDILG